MNWSYIISKRKYSPFLMIIVIRATVLGFAKVFPSKIILGASYWHNSDSSYFYPDKQLQETVDKMCRWGIKNPEKMEEFFNTAYLKSRKLNNLVKSFLQTHNLNKCSSQELIGFLHKYYQEFYDFYIYGTAPTLLGYREDNALYFEMNKILKAKTRHQPESFAKHLVNLTSSEKTTIANDCELDILSLASKLKKAKINSQMMVLKKFNQDLTTLVKKYAFLSFDLLASSTWDKKYFVKTALERSQELNLPGLITDLKNYNKNTSQAIKESEEELKLNDKEKIVFRLIRQVGYYKWIREYEFVESLYGLTAIQDELGGRLGLDEIESKSLLPEEFGKALDQPLVMKRLAQRRQKSFLFLVDNKHGDLYYYGQEARQKFSQMKFTQEQFKQGRTIKGMPARPGKVVGRVKLVNDVKDMRKVELGDILVSVATTPAIITAMKKASGFITDEGGITCHAAIVAREMKKPCIVGTRNATKILKDNQLVELNANLGKIKIIS